MSRHFFRQQPGRRYSHYRLVLPRSLLIQGAREPLPLSQPWKDASRHTKNDGISNGVSKVKCFIPVLFRTKARSLLRPGPFKLWLSWNSMFIFSTCHQHLGGGPWLSDQYYCSAQYQELITTQSATLRCAASGAVCTLQAPRGPGWAR